MSINVTVTGNPVSIKRGKMITTTGDPQEAKKEFDKRRLLRLEQVRQQSKELAENVRNKVLREKKRQLGQIEKEGKEKLKNWQNRKLLDLQNQYLDALDEIGIGHKEAEEYADENDIFECHQKQNKEVAKTRGKLAGTKLQVEKNEKNFKQALPLQHKKLVRDIENTRAAMVSSMKRKSPKKQAHSKVKKNKTSADINISIPENSDISEGSSSSDSSKHLPSIQEEEQSNDSEGFCECSESSSERQLQEEVNKSSKSNKDEKSYWDTLQDRAKLIDSFRCKQSKEAAGDTRISDRIRQRQLTAARPDFCDCVDDPKPLPQVFKCPNLPKSSGDHVRKPPKDPLELSSDECVCSKLYASCPCKNNGQKSAAVQTDLTENNANWCKCGAESQVKSRNLSVVKEQTKPPDKEQTEFQQGIPSKPPVKLKDVGTATSKAASGGDKVRHYDFANRFSSDKQSTSQIERIDLGSIEALPNITSERDRLEIMRQRDKEALDRGKKALEKERVRKDYEELMKKLPVLQRKEHISRIGSDRPEYHMSDERLKEREQERQNRLENAYLQAVPELKPHIVTLPRRKPQETVSDKPFEIIDHDDPRTLNLGKWDTDSRPKTMFSAEEVQEIIKAFTVQKPEDRKAKLKQLLKSLKLQKEQLINEIRALPRDDSIDALLGDLTSFSDEKEDEKPKKSKESKRRREESDTSNTSDEIVAGKKKENKPKTPKHKKAKKSTPKVRILQNTSTQTTPKTTKEQSSSTLSGSDPPQKESKDVKTCSKTHIPCDCSSAISSEEICKIFIKLGEDDKKAKVEIQPKGQEQATKNVSGIVASEQREKSPSEPKKSPPSKSEKSPRKPEKSPRKPETSLKKHSKPFKKSDKENEAPINVPTKSSERKALARRREESWKEQLSKNSISTSSTSYLSPPDYTKMSETSSSVFKLRKKPQQTNAAGDLLLLNYIKRLLSMSKNSIEDLGVSSSDVQTPSQSIIEMESNNPLAALQDALKRGRNITPSTEGFLAPPNTSFEETSGRSSRSSRPQDAEKITNELLSQYADVTDSCTKRIANLAAMIEQLRREKMQMISSPPLAAEEVLVSPNFSEERENNSSTKYLDLPPGEKSKGTNSTASMDEEELNKRLIDIDMSLAEKLKRFRQEQVRPEVEEDEPDHQFLDRLQRLMREEQLEPERDGAEVEKPFVQFLVDIPKLPILEPEPEGLTLNESRRRPPPSKGLTTAKKFNGNISLVPHELSTIVEADSQLSTKVSPNASKLQQFEPVDSQVTIPKTVAEQSESSKSLTCTESTCTNICTSMLSSSSSSSDMKSIEAMLKSIGMEWAIPTLHKTQEALALTSSSSSGDLSSKKHSASELSLKEFLKKQMAGKISSSSLNKSDASPSSFVRECSEMSAIQVTISSGEKSKQRTSTPVMTSKSPMSKSKEDHTHLFTGASDISSVHSASGRQGSAKRTFKSLGDDEESSLTKSIPSD